MRTIPKYQMGNLINLVPSPQNQQVEQQPEDTDVTKYLNFLSPSALVGATVRKLTGNTKDFTDLVTEGTGIFTENFHREHPIIAALGNMAADIPLGMGIQGIAGGLGALAGAGAIKLASKAPAGILKVLPKGTSSRIKFVGAGASGGSPTLGFKHAQRYLEGVDSQGNPVNKLEVLRYMLTGKGKENLGAIYTGGTRPVVANYRGKPQAARYTEVPSREPSILQVNQGVVDETFNGQKLFKQLREANEVNAGILPEPFKVEGGIIIGSRKIINNPTIQQAIDGRQVIGHRLTPVVVSDEVNGGKALRLLNSGEEPVYKMSITQRRIKGERQNVTDLEGNPIPGNRDNYTFNSGGINVYFYKKNGRLRRVEVDVYDHANTPNSTKYGTNISEVDFMKKYFSKYPIKQELKKILSQSEETSSLLVRYNSEMSSADFRHAMANNFTIKKTTNGIQLEVNEEGVDNLIDVLGNSKTGERIERAVYNGADNTYISDFFVKKVKDMAKEKNLVLDDATTRQLANMMKDKVTKASRDIGELSKAYKQKANEKMGDILHKLESEAYFGETFNPTEADLQFMEEYADDIAAFMKYSNAGRTFAFSENPNDWLTVLRSNTTIKNPRVQRQLLTDVRPHNVNAQLRKRAENTILFVNRYQNPATRMGTTDTFFEGLDITPEKIQELHRLLHI